MTAAKKRGPGRPKMKSSEKRGAMLGVRLKPEERAAVDRAAERAGVKASEWVRRMIVAASAGM